MENISTIGVKSVNKTDAYGILPYAWLSLVEFLVQTVFYFSVITIFRVFIVLSVAIMLSVLHSLLTSLSLSSALEMYGWVYQRIYPTFMKISSRLLSMS